ncbi:damage-control phosphatase ARMT1 isoform X1 [Pogona vitticeps]
MAVQRSQLPVSLAGKFKGSFAYYTITDRLPLILTKVIDTLHRHKNEFFEEYGEKGLQAEKNAIAYLSKLRNELQTDKPLIALNDNLPDTVLWNQFLEYHQNLSNEPPSWFQSPWLYTECYMYRRIHEALVQNPPISDYDVFKEEKEHAFFDSQQAIIALSTYLQELLKNIENQNEESLNEEFFKLIQVSLWGNKCDLSISAGADNSQKANPLQSVEDLKSFILVDHMEKLWLLLMKRKKINTQTSVTSTRIDIVLVNAGFELIADLVLADFLTSSKLVTIIHFHGKSIPWYVSDTTKRDLNWTIKQMGSANNKCMSSCGVSWEGYVKKGVWVYHDHLFWTLPHEFSSMAQVAPDLYAELQKSDLIIFKGDLNYRKLLGDRKWEFIVPFHQALNNFHPAPLCSLRTLKCDIQVGLKPGQGEKLSSTEPEWMITGKYGIIQFDGAS